MRLTDILEGYSKALYSTWLHYRPDRLLIDCGEGCATSLGNSTYAIEKLLLTHGHIDHVSGIASLLWARASGMGDNQKPLQIHYPKGDPYVGDLRNYIDRTAARLPFSLEWHETQPEQRISLRANRFAVPFATRHLRHGLSLGYRITEQRRRLRPEFAALPEHEIRDLARQGKSAEIMETIEATLAVFGGDGVPLSLTQTTGADLLVHEATLLNAADRKSQLHSTLDEAVELAARARVKTLLLYHVSGRYRVAEIEQAIQRSVTTHQLEASVWCLYRDKLWKPKVRP